ncbi:MAG: HypC/HybG/HupF family hydrogenase formation chaperone [Ignavibacteria bacterium]|nr:HypC/HybG/HupF family hydrogenase formation chaperone [Ignavibacteria bacterium]
MQLVTGEIIEIIHDADGRRAIVRVRGARMNVTIALVPDVKPGDRVLIESGVAIAKVNEGEE